MYFNVRRLYLLGMLTVAGLQNAVNLGGITAEQKEEIIASK